MFPLCAASEAVIRVFTHRALRPAFGRVQTNPYQSHQPLFRMKNSKTKTESELKCTDIRVSMMAEKRRLILNPHQHFIAMILNTAKMMSLVRVLAPLRSMLYPSAMSWKDTTTCSAFGECIIDRFTCGGWHKKTSLRCVECQLTDLGRKVFFVWFNSRHHWLKQNAGVPFRHKSHNRMIMMFSVSMFIMGWNLIAYCS